MISKRILFVSPSLLVMVLASLCTVAVYPSVAQAQGAQTAAPAVAKPAGTVKLVNGNTITLTTSPGAEVNVQVQDSTRLVKLAPGQSLKDATAIQLKDVEVGDRVLAHGTLSEDGKTVLASSAYVMKKTDIADKQQHDLEDWKKRGVDGVVKAVDPATGTVTISTNAAGVTKTTEVHTSKDTIVRRYPPNSAKYEDAKLGTLDQIKPGDQLRARGDRTPDGNAVNAQEIISGTFLNIAGTVTSVDPTKETVSILDLLSKKPIVVHITTESQMRKLPVFVAQRIAMRLKGINCDAVSGAAPTGEALPPNAAGAASSSNGSGGPTGGTI